MSLIFQGSYRCEPSNSEEAHTRVFVLDGEWHIVDNESFAFTDDIIASIQHNGWVGPRGLKERGGGYYLLHLAWVVPEKWPGHFTDIIMPPLFNSLNAIWTRFCFIIISLIFFHIWLFFKLEHGKVLSIFRAPWLISSPRNPLAHRA